MQLTIRLRSTVWRGSERLDPIEKAIRSALEKGNADDRAFREKVYRSAFAALDRALDGNPNIPEDAAAKRRKDLQAKIAEIETEFIPAVPSVDSPASPQAAPPPVAAPAAPAAERAPGAAPSIELDSPGREPTAPSIAPDSRRGDPVVDVPPATRSAARVEPSLDVRPQPAAGRREPSLDMRAEPPSSRRVEPQLAGDPAPTAAEPPAGRAVPESFFPDVADFDAAGTPASGPETASVEVSAAEGPNVATERRRPIAGIFLGVTLLALAGIGIWWGISTGLIKIPGPPDTDVIEEVPVPDEEFTPGEEEEPQKPGEADAERDWITIFSPSDPSTMNAPGDAKAETMNDDAGAFVRIRSGASGSAVVFDVPRGVLEQISGKHAEFNVVARSEEGKETQFAVECNFGELGDCGRKRYLASYQKGDFLFAIDLQAKAPGAEGTIAITSDVDNSGKALDVFEIRVSVSE
jgi:hypothetical protein